MKEYILCAAIWFNDGKPYVHQPKNVPKGFVICGRRHHNCLQTVDVLNAEKRLPYKHIQGFLTNTDRFVTRARASLIAFEAGQIKKETNCLMSEDLY